MSRSIHLLIYILLSCGAFSQQKSKAAKTIEKNYFPPQGEWQHQSASALGFDSVKLQSVIELAIQHESKQPRNMEISQAMTFGKEPFGYGIGPFSDRGNPTGIIVHKGYIIA